MSVAYRRIDELKLDPANPRRHGKKQIRMIANSIKAFGFNVPVLIAIATTMLSRAMAVCWHALCLAYPRCRRCASITSLLRKCAPL
jgi:hypothetical protein